MERKKKGKIVKFIFFPYVYFSSYLISIFFLGKHLALDNFFQIPPLKRDFDREGVEVKVKSAHNFPIILKIL